MKLKKIVVLDDSFIIRSKLMEYFNSLGYLVFNSHCPREVIKYLDTSEADWLIINPLLINNSGWELLYEMHSWLDLRSIKVIIISYDKAKLNKHQSILKELNICHVLNFNELDLVELNALL